MLLDHTQEPLQGFLPEVTPDAPYQLTGQRRTEERSATRTGTGLDRSECLIDDVRTEADFLAIS